MERKLKFQLFFMLCFGAQVVGLKALGLYECFGGLGHNFERILERFARIFGGLKPSWARLGRVLEPLGGILGHLGGVLGASWAPNPKQSEGNLFLESILGSVWGGSWCILGALGDVLEGIFASLGVFWACLNKNLEKGSIFEISKTFF